MFAHVTFFLGGVIGYARVVFQCENGSGVDGAPQTHRHSVKALIFVFRCSDLLFRYPLVSVLKLAPRSNQPGVFGQAVRDDVGPPGTCFRQIDFRNAKLVDVSNSLQNSYGGWGGGQDDLALNLSVSFCSSVTLVHELCLTREVTFFGPDFAKNLVQRWMGQDLEFLENEDVGQVRTSFLCFSSF